MEVLVEGKGELVGWHDPDEAREWVMQNKSRELINKVTTAKEAVEKYIYDGAYIACGGFGHVRTAMSIVYEIIRQKKRNLTVAGNTVAQDSDLLVGSGCANKIEVAYFGHEMRGLSHATKRKIETGQCKAIGEITNGGYQWRFLAGMMGLPFVPSRTMLGTDTLNYSSSKVVKDPFSGKHITLIPAAYPDAAFIHVNRCDIYGNCQIDMSPVQDFELARCARRLIITTEEIVDTEVIRSKPWRTAIPYMVVDAVVEAPYGSHPCHMPDLYFFDEEHIAEWLGLSKTDEGIEAYLNKYVFGVSNFEEYLELCGGVRQMNYLKRREQRREPLVAPWKK